MHMPNNSVRLKPVRELSGLDFFIPDYQRGYRWTSLQVRDLLNDIKAFMKKQEDEKKSSGFYCLQPLVVKGNLKNRESILESLNDEEVEMSELYGKILGETRWEVVDGQQRLTTINIILSYFLDQNVDLGEFRLYGLEYQTRSDSRDFLEQIANSKTPCQNEPIDFYFMREAFNTVSIWFSRNQGILADFARTLLDDVQFIWYETSEKPTTVFKRLNLGKISLTNAELIKALFLNREHFGEYDKKQVVIAEQWDSFENTLQNDEFWLFIHDAFYGKPTRIEFIFDIIFERKLLDSYIDWDDEEKYPEGRDKFIGTDKYKTFRYFSAFFESAKAVAAAYEKKITIIELCWSEVKKIFRAFEEWYSDLELYHYVGFLINDGKCINDLLDDWTKMGKDTFVAELKKSIKNSIQKCKDLNKQYEIEDNEKKTACRPLLLLHNVQTIINQNREFQDREDYKLGVFYKFPYHLYKKETWNVEHVDSNTTNESESETEKSKWLKVSWCFLPVGEPLRDRILNYFNDKNEDFFVLQNLILHYFGNKGMPLSQENKNKIWNFVLLDEHTNKSYKNAIFPMKKMVISGRDHGFEYVIEDVLDDQVANRIAGFKLKEEKTKTYKTAFVPPITKSVFMKEYNPLSANYYSWDSDDADKYKANIAMTLKEFLA